MSTPTSAALVTGVLFYQREMPAARDPVTVHITVTVVDKTMKAGKMEEKLDEMIIVLRTIEECIENGREIDEGRKCTYEREIIVSRCEDRRWKAAGK